MRRLFGSVSPWSLRPATSTSPRSGVTSAAIIDTVVVLPAPFGPSSPTSCPAATLNETSSTARSGPYVLRRFLTCSIDESEARYSHVWVGGPVIFDERLSPRDERRPGRGRSQVEM